MNGIFFHTYHRAFRARLILFVAASLASLCLVACQSPEDIGEPVYGASVLVEEGALDFAGEGDRRARIYIITNINDWTAEKNADWVRFYDDVEQAEELHRQRILEVWAEDNDDTENSRTASITIRAGDFSRTLTVTQQPGMPSIVLDGVSAAYSGDVKLDGRGQYDLTFTFGEFDENGNPIGELAGILNVALLNSFVPGVYGPTAAAGIYTASSSSDDKDALRFVPGNITGATPTGTYYVTYTEGVRRVRYITGGRFEIDDEGNCRMRFVYDGSTTARFVYSGTIAYENREELSAAGAYLHEEGQPIIYDLRLYAGRMERNKITDYGYEIFLECSNDAMYDGSYAIRPGDYVLGEGRDLTFSPGGEDSGSRVIIYEPYTEDGSVDGPITRSSATPITGGTLSIACEQSIYTVTFDLSTADLRRARGQYTGEIRFRAK